MIVVGAFDAGFRSDASGGSIVFLAKDGRAYSAATFERRPRKGLPLVPSVVTREFAELAKSYGAKKICVDQFYIESVREHVKAVGLEVVEAPSGQQGKASVYMVARERLHGGKVRIPAGQRQLISQLRDVLGKPLPGGGISITSPRRRGTHGDLASAFVNALWLAEQLGRAKPINLFVGGVPSHLTRFGGLDNGGRGW